MQCDHVWETVQSCFNCDAIRPFQEDTDIVSESDRSCPKDQKWELIKELAFCDQAGLSVTLKRLISTAHKMVLSGRDL